MPNDIKSGIQIMVSTNTERPFAKKGQVKIINIHISTAQIPSVQFQILQLYLWYFLDNFTVKSQTGNGTPVWHEKATKVDLH